MRGTALLIALAVVALPAAAENAPAQDTMSGDAAATEPTAEEIAGAEEALLAEIPGDAAYGAYLAGECTACHQPGQANEGVPWITGWAEEDFALAMLDYRIRVRQHPIMAMVAGRLGDEEIAALAAHFATLD